MTSNGTFLFLWDHIKHPELVEIKKDIDNKKKILKKLFPEDIWEKIANFSEFTKALDLFDYLYFSD